MCLVSKPSIPKSSTTSDKPLPVIRNPLLDGLLGNVAANRAGTNAFRIDLINPLSIPAGSGSGGGSASGGGGAGGSSGAGSSGGSAPGIGGGGGGTTSTRFDGVAGGGGGRNGARV